ncbi:MAG TPA: hypothetical protein VHD33_08105, partial [Legionellaceae bacterium]|nr:hypothetical protein [Legionellaceae bacterium]
MKRLVFLILLCLIGYLHTTAQTAYYDALKLKALLIQKNGALVFDDSKWSQVFQILKPYTYNPQTGAYQDSDKDIYKNFCIANGRNPFICDYFAGGFAGGAQNFIASVANSVGNTNISTIADGLTKFLIERAKEELFIAFFSNLKNNQKFPEFPVLFPHTQVLLNNFNSWEYSNIINSLREAFDKDLQDLLVDIPKLKDVDCSKCETDAKNRINAFKKFVQQTDDGRIFLSALQLGNGFISEQKVSDVIHIIASDTSYLLNMPSVKANLNIKNGIRLFDILSYSIRSNVNGVSYISGNDFKAMITDPVAGNIYLGLIYQQLKNENIQIGAINLANYLNTNKAAAIQPYLNNLLTQGDALATAINNLLAAKKKGEKDLTTYWAANFESGKQLLLSLTNISLIEPTLTFDKTIQNV